MPLENLLSLLSALAFSVIFFFGSRIHLPGEGEQYYRRTVSLSAGVGVAYVFLELLPELSVAQEVLRRSAEPSTLLFEKYRVYLGALTGFVFFYGAHHIMALVSKDAVEEKVWRAGNWPFLLYVSVFFFYVWLVTYLRVNSLEEVHGSKVFYSVAMAFHFILIDYSLRREYGELYLKRVKNALAIAPILGWLVGIYVVLPVTVVIPMISFVSGGIVMNTMILEMPRENESRFLYFFLGAAIFGSFIMVFN